MLIHGHFIRYDILEYEIVTADGTCVTATEDENTDLFFALPFSYGTLGYNSFFNQDIEK